MPDATAQFKSAPHDGVYMGGTTIGCGQHPTTPKRHRWTAWDGEWRMCKNCGLCQSKGDLAAKRLKPNPDREV